MNKKYTPTQEIGCPFDEPNAFNPKEKTCTYCTDGKYCPDTHTIYTEKDLNKQKEIWLSELIDETNGMHGEYVREYLISQLDILIKGI